MTPCSCDKDILKIHIDSENAEYESETVGKYSYDIKLPVKRKTYKKLILYVDNFNIQTKGLSHLSYIVNADILEYNSYNSRTKGANTVLASIFAYASGSGRTSDFALNYKNPTAPIQIQNIPDYLNITITDIDNSGIDLSNAENFWNLDLRIEAYY